MSEEFEIKLKTSRVTLEKSYVPGDIYTCGNDEAWFMINDNLAELVGDKTPNKPQRLIDLEQQSEPDQDPVQDLVQEPVQEPEPEPEPEPVQEPVQKKQQKKGKKK